MRRRSSGLLGLVLIAMWGAPAAQPLRAQDALRGRSGAAVERAAGFESIDRLLAEHVDRQQIAGAVAKVFHDGQVVYSSAVGMRDREAGQEMTEDTIFRIASMTKPVTSVAVMMLRDAGRLRLDDPASKYVPELAEMQVLEIADGGQQQLVPSRRKITIGDLLTHTSGITYRFMAPEPVGRRYTEAGVSDGLAETPGTIGENVRRLARVPLVDHPGEAWHYGLSIDVLGRIVEVASGKSLAEFFDERIFAPLEMNDTYFELPKEKLPRLAALYRPGEDGTIEPVGEGKQTEAGLTYSATYPLPGSGEYYSGGAGLVSTAGDYLRFLRMLLGGGQLEGVRLLEEETVAEMTRNQIGGLDIAFPIHGDKFGYGFGVHSEQSELRHGASPGTYSWGGVFHTYFWVDPREEVIGVLMTQLYPFGHLSMWADFQETVYESLGE